MSGDNRVFDVNGSSEGFLKDVLKLAFMQDHDKAIGYKIDSKKGFVLYWATTDDKESECIKFPVPLSYIEVCPLVWAFLKSDEAKKIKLKGFDADFDHDGHNGSGWRVYCEGWGHIGNDWQAFLAITPALMWYGK